MIGNIRQPKFPFRIIEIPTFGSVLRTKLIKAKLNKVWEFFANIFGLQT